MDYTKVRLVEGNTVKYFFRKYYFLSNFFWRSFVVDGVKYATNEHFFQSKKTLWKDEEFAIINAPTTRDAKRLGRLCTLRPTWEDIKIKVMWKGLVEKFIQHEDLKQRLLDTGDMILEEGNDWRDTFWGVVNGKGTNHLGRLLMKVRDKLRKQGE